MSLMLFPTFCSFRVGVSGFILRSFIPLDLSFVQGDKYETICIFLPIEIQLGQRHFLKMFSSFHCIVLPSLQKSSVYRRVALFQSLKFDSIYQSVCCYTNSLPCHYYCSVVHPEFREGDNSRCVFIV